LLTICLFVYFLFPRVRARVILTLLTLNFILLTKVGAGLWGNTMNYQSIKQPTIY